MLDQNYVDAVILVINQYLWKGLKPRVKLDMLTLSKKDAGLNLFNLQLKDQSLKMQWVKAYHQDLEIKVLADKIRNNRIGDLL